jgi:hypothetical protein
MESADVSATMKALFAHQLARLDVRLADASPTDGAQDTAATPRKAAAYDR